MKINLLKALIKILLLSIVWFIQILLAQRSSFPNEEIRSNNKKSISVIQAFKDKNNSDPLLK